MPVSNRKDVDKTPGTARGTRSEKSKSNDSPSLRRLVTPGGVGAGPNSTSPFNVPENDDTAEIRQQHRNRVLEMQNKGQSSPSTPSERRKSLSSGVAGYSNAQLSEHYTNCIKLSTENKITIKNAFGLHLIDCMAEMIKANDSQMSNFQTASCTLDASAKIYAYRVDVIHAEAFKMAGGLGKKSDGKDNDNDRDGGDEGGLDEDEQRQARKKAKRSVTIETNLAALNMNRVDKFAMQGSILAQFGGGMDDGGGSNSLLLNYLGCHDDNFQLCFDSSLALPKVDLVQVADRKVDVNCLNLIENVDALGDVKICPSFANFKFLGWTVQDEDVCDSPEVPIRPTQSTYGASGFAFDLNADTDPILSQTSADVMDVDQLSTHSNQDIFGDDPNDDNDVDGFDFVSGIDRDRDRRKTLTLRNMDEILSTTVSEYSYFDQNILSAWAGPHHWKMKNIRAKTAVGPDGDPESRPAARPVNRKPEFFIDYTDDSMDQCFKKLSAKTKKNHKLARVTLESWDADKIKLPVDLKYKTENLAMLFTRPNQRILRRKGIKMDADVNVDGYNYDNRIDQENFCPTQDMDDDDENGGFSDAELDDQFGSEMTTVFRNAAGADFANTALSITTMGGAHADRSNSLSDLSGGGAFAFTDDNLVQQPYKIPKLNIAYAKQAKKVDIKKLKSSMWRMLATDHANASAAGDLSLVDPTQSTSAASSGRTSRMSDDSSLKFSNLYRNLPAELSGTLKDNLSVPIAFVCLLYLANEKNLKIEMQDNLLDAIITLE